jgi:hypothetical protein
VASPPESLPACAMEWYSDRIDTFVDGQRGIDDAPFPKRSLVDYVRIYRQP